MAPPAAPAENPPNRHRGSPYLTATVVVCIVAAAAGVFAGSYCFAMAKPTPHRVPVGVTGTSPAGDKLIAGLDTALDTSLELHPFPDVQAARQAVDRQQVFAVLQRQSGRVELDVAGAAGASVARVFSQTAPRVGTEIGVPVTVVDIKPLQRTDPQGLAIFYIALAAVIVGFIGATQLGMHASGLPPGARVAFTAAYSVLGGFAISAIVDWLLGVLDLPFLESWGISSLTMFASGMAFSMFHKLVGRWALIPTWVLTVLLGNPSSGGAVSWPLLPQPLGYMGRWLPTGAAVSAQHTAIYFGSHQHLEPFLVITGWIVLGCAVFFFWREPRRGGATGDEAAGL